MTAVSQGRSRVWGLKRVWGIDELGLLINSKEENVSWWEIGYVKKIGKAEGSRCRIIIFYQGSLIRITWEALKNVDASAFAEQLNVRCLWASGFLKPFHPGDSDVHPDWESFCQREKEERSWETEVLLEGKKDGQRYRHTCSGSKLETTAREGRGLSLDLEGLHLSIVKVVPSPERRRGSLGSLSN